MSALAAAPAGRILATPYARRLARERGVPLAALAGSGPNGRVVAADVIGFVPAPVQPAPPPAAAPAPVPAEAPAVPAAAAVPVPAALAVAIDFSAVADLLARLGDLAPGVGREDVCLKAAAVALAEAPALDGAIGLPGGARDGGRVLGRLAGLSLGGIAARRAASEPGVATLALSFIGRAGLRPVAAPIPAGAVARLVVGGADAAGIADCLLSYDPDRLDDGDAAAYLAAFKALVETPLRLLV
ncbi:E3 binding domain-containing protein [Prosthecomicrobium pneumaticum]|uniref:Pyruvate dehydrogenase E2 component (Dihydrolipoamide acetyltransferase) n=1 Tax=Prosthecomicrobium pneumaticum TaxID=81895 RepID=A0A7W9CVA4_9HYPH|nr:pyruvate dehydrogenase E2 component (dihydrolipoamide acetyltransferase) [Prosthecomicrobium pneumaticum]